MVTIIYCDNCNKDITKEKHYVTIKFEDKRIESEHDYMLCEKCFDRAYNIIRTIVPAGIWDGSPVFPKVDLTKQVTDIN